VTALFTTAMWSMNLSTQTSFARDELLGEAVVEQEETEMPRPGPVGGQRRERADGRMGDEGLTEHEFGDVVGVFGGGGEGDHQADVVPDEPDVLVVADRGEQAVDVDGEEGVWPNLFGAPTGPRSFDSSPASSRQVKSPPFPTLRDLRDDKAIKHHPATRTAAKHLLDDRVLGGQLELVVNDMVKVLLDGRGVVLAIDGFF